MSNWIDDAAAKRQQELDDQRATSESIESQALTLCHSFIATLKAYSEYLKNKYPGDLIDVITDGISSVEIQKHSGPTIYTTTWFDSRGHAIRITRKRTNKEGARPETTQEVLDLTLNPKGQIQITTIQGQRLTIEEASQYILKPTHDSILGYN